MASRISAVGKKIGVDFVESRDEQIVNSSTAGHWLAREAAFTQRRVVSPIYMELD
jgi:hypothetical protein